MNIQLVVLNGSPIIDSSTEFLLHAATNSIVTRIEQSKNTAVQVHVFRLNDWSNSSPCQSCGKAPSDEWCFYHDAITPALDAIGEADAILIGSPIHFDAVSAQTKLLVDRCNCFRPADFSDANLNYRFLKRLTRKRPGGMILVGGPDAWFEGARRSLAGWFKWVEVENLGVVTFQSTDFNHIGAAKDDDLALSAARGLGESIANRLASPDIWPNHSEPT